MKRVLALALLVAMGASCGGKSEDEKVFEQRRDICNGIVAKGETVSQAAADFQAAGLNGPNGSVIDCRSDFSLPAGSQCQTGQSVCKLFWQTIALDRGLCNSVSGGCVYACEAFTPGQAAADVTGASVICATLFISGQPFLF